MTLPVSLGTADKCRCEIKRKHFLHFRKTPHMVSVIRVKLGLRKEKRRFPLESALAFRENDKRREIP